MLPTITHAKLNREIGISKQPRTPPYAQVQAVPKKNRIIITLRITAVPIRTYTCTSSQVFKVKPIEYFVIYYIRQGDSPFAITIFRTNIGAKMKTTRITPLIRLAFIS